MYIHLYNTWFYNIVCKLFKYISNIYFVKFYLKKLYFYLFIFNFTRYEGIRTRTSTNPIWVVFGFSIWVNETRKHKRIVRCNFNQLTLNLHQNKTFLYYKDDSNVKSTQVIKLVEYKKNEIVWNEYKDNVEI